MLEVLFLDTARDVFDELDPADPEAIIEALRRAQSFPRMYPLRQSRPSPIRPAQAKPLEDLFR
jgi:hypothetical protein